eukprot:UN24333
MSKQYGYDGFFDEYSNTEQVYNGTAKQLVEPLFEGYNGCLFCYGPTGTGKTFTMFGTKKIPGLVRLVATDLFNYVKMKREENENVNIKIGLSAMEVYGEQISDLIGYDTKKKLELRTTKRGACFVRNLSKLDVKSIEQFMTQVRKCRDHRVTKQTGANDTSSRSHCIIQVFIKSSESKSTNIYRCSKLNLIDLAGSERAHQTKLKRDRMNESCGINSSLLALKKCIRCLVQKKS